MGSFVEINDTLQLTAEQGFPRILDIERHSESPIKLADVAETVFEFHSKPGIRNFQQPPVRVFFAENRNGKWLYWGKVEVLTVTHDYVGQSTSGSYRITEIFSPEEMREAFRYLDERKYFDYFSSY